MVDFPMLFDFPMITDHAHVERRIRSASFIRTAARVARVDGLLMAISLLELMVSVETCVLFEHFCVLACE